MINQIKLRIGYCKSFRQKKRKLGKQGEREMRKENKKGLCIRKSRKQQIVESKKCAIYICHVKQIEQNK